MRYLALIVMLVVQSSITLAQQSPSTGTAVVEGMVVNALNSRQIPRAGVLLRDAQNFNKTVWVRADDTGRFLVKNVDAGTYRITADRQGFFSENRKNATQTFITVSANDHVKNVLVRLLPFAVISGRVVDEKNDPVQHVDARLYAWDYVRGRRVLTAKGLAATDDRGEFRIAGVRPGSYFLLAHYDFKKEWLRTMGDLAKTTRPDIAYLPEFFPGTTDFRDAQQLTVKAGDEVLENFSFSSHPAVAIHGRVVNGVTGQPIAKATVTASWASIPIGIDPITAQTGEDGTFDMWGLAPGSYVLQTSFKDRDENYSGQHPVEVGGAGVANTEVAGMPDFEMHGSVRVAGSQPTAIKYVSVEFMTAGNEPFNIFRVGAGGPNFQLQGRLHLETHYRVNAVNLPDEYYLKSVTVAGREVPKNDVVVTARYSQIEMVISADGGHVEGTVLDFKNQPVRGSFVMLAPDVAEIDPDQIMQSRSDTNGKFVLRGVPPGSYKLLAFEDVNVDDLMAAPDVLRRFVNQGQALNVAENGKYNFTVPKFIPADVVP